jgi:hypothetical protein
VRSTRAWGTRFRALWEPATLQPGRPHHAATRHAPFSSASTFWEVSVMRILCTLGSSPSNAFALIAAILVGWGACDDGGTDDELTGCLVLGVRRANRGALEEHNNLRAGARGGEEAGGEEGRG